MRSALDAYHKKESPHSLGKLIEWKHARSDGRTIWRPLSPHSLGKLIEWKPQIQQRIVLWSVSVPHSLGKLIEWKLPHGDYRRAHAVGLPTRWGN